MSDPQFHRYTAAQAREQRAAVESIYRRSYVEAIESGHEFDDPAAFMTRFDAYTRAQGFDLVIGSLDGRPIGQSWGWPLQPGAAWWTNLVLDDPDTDRDEFVHETGTRTFALSEIMVDRAHTGLGYARALHDELLSPREEVRATLLVENDNTRAYGRYQRWGWSRVGSLKPHWPNAPTFDVMVRKL